ncbi:RNA-binding domain-containing protein [Bimuria novae-zelandiae CBS 107.79]|uniref:RNA-binding domain-containing protein n=1 Tax=Bimuria novae-zelandiae CBS 107.79 TaxID=1447943 RepID=A0A6A5VA17_9PLEO|nr:RNA-binding domain-containing protein [Bimuria novae-zelandiae CBS 107.79]
MAALARPAPPPGKGNSLPPNRTLYVNNLNDKLPKNDLKRNLYMLFATYGVILDVVALKTPKMRGQAHIVFRDIDSSTQAMRALEGFTFFGRDMRIRYAKSKSDTIAKLDGTFKLPEPDLPERQEATEQTGAAAAVFGSAPAKAVPVNEQDRAKGMKRAREEEEEEESEDDEEMQMSESDEE